MLREKKKIFLDLSLYLDPPHKLMRTKAHPPSMFGLNLSSSFCFVILLTEQPAVLFEYITSLVEMIMYILPHHPPTPRKAFSKVQLPPYIVNPSRLMESPVLMLWSSICRCSHFKQALKPCYMYDARWVCSKVFRFIIKWMKRYLCESKLIQMCSGVSWHLCLSIHKSKFDLVGF